MTIHATAVALGNRAVLLRGASGVGKSDLALRLLALPSQAMTACGFDAAARPTLVADDRVALARHQDRLLASAPPTIAGKLEVRGIGIVDITATSATADVYLVADLVNAASVERMPEPTSAAYLGLHVRCIAIAPFEASAPLKIALALSAASRPWPSETPRPK